MHCRNVFAFWHFEITQHDIDGQKMSHISQGEFQLSKFQDGVLPAAFMVGLLVASLVFSELCKHYNAFRLIGKLGQQSRTCNICCTLQITHAFGAAFVVASLPLCFLQVRWHEINNLQLFQPLLDTY